MTFFEELYEALPPHIKDDKDFVKILSIFFETIEEQYVLSNDSLQSKMVDVLASKFKEGKKGRFADRREDLLKLHLNELFEAVDRAQKDERFYKRITRDFSKLGLKPQNFQIEEKFLKVLNQGHINSNKSFNENKGKLISFLYAFNIVSQSGVQGINGTDGFLKVIENTDPITKVPLAFSYRVESSLYEETFDTLIKPLTHPLGFGYTFVTLLQFEFEDYFSVQIIKHLDSCVIRCLQPDGTYIETDMMVHEIIAFNEINHEKGVEFWMKYRDKDTKELMTLRVGLDRVVRFYSLENPRISWLRLVDEKQGVIKERRAEDGTLDEILYHQYFINRKRTIHFLYRLEGDLAETTYEAMIPYNPNDYSVIPGEPYVQAKKITAEDLISSTYGEFYGRMVKELPRTCGLHYTIRLERISTIREDLIFEYGWKWYDFVARKPCIHLVQTEYFIGKAVNPFKDPSSWVPLIGDFYIGKSDTVSQSPNTYFIGKAHNIHRNPPYWEPEIGEYDIGEEATPLLEMFKTTTTYFVGLATDDTKNPSEWVPILGEYIITDEPASTERPEISATPLPPVEVLGKNEEWWFKEYPCYDTKVDSTYIESSKPELFNPCAFARDIMTAEETLNIKQNDFGSYLSFDYWRIGEQIIGCPWDEEEIGQFISGQKYFPDNEQILTIEYLYKKERADGDLYPSSLINDYDLEIYCDLGQTVFDVITIEESDDFTVAPVGNFLDGVLHRNTIGNDPLIINNTWQIGLEYSEEFEQVKALNINDLTKHDYEFDTIPTNIGDWDIGNDYTWFEIEDALEGKFQFDTDVLWVGYKFGKKIYHGDRYPMHNFDEDLEIELIRK